MLSLPSETQRSLPLRKAYHLSSIPLRLRLRLTCVRNGITARSHEPRRPTFNGAFVPLTQLQFLAAPICMLSSENSENLTCCGCAL